MIRAIIVDDEENARINLRNLLEKFCQDVKVLAQADSVNTALDFISIHRPDLVFLDIEMPGASGFELLKQIGDPDFQVIFITAYSEYAVKAFRLSAVDYLLKPINIAELREAIKKVGNNLQQQATASNYENLLHNHRHSNPNDFKIAFPQSNGYVFVPLKDIIRCESDRNYTRILLSKGNPLLISKTIKLIEELLDNYPFLRVHQSHIVNLQYITEYVKSDGGYLVMEDKVHIPVSRQKREALINMMKRI